MSDTADIAAPSLRVFLSYSRVDTAFVDEIAAGLPLVGNFDVTLDRHSIETGVDWQERLEDLIEEADAVVFILSPDFVKSDICAWEVAVAARLGKRLVPLLLRPLGTALAPPALGVINYVDATASDTMIATLKTLGNTLKTDLEWLKQSTRLLNLAQDWNEAGRPDNRLLFAADIDGAMAWLESTPDGVVVTDLQRDFVNASSAAFTLQQGAEQRRLEEVAQANARAAHAARRGQRRALAGLALSACLAVVAGVAWYYATRAEHTAEMNAQLADLEREAASEAQAAARAALRESRFVIYTMVESIGFQDTGFDCEVSLKLERPVEFMICANPGLAEQDRLLSTRYFTLYGKLSQSDKDKLKDEQKIWLRSRYLSCTPDFGKQIAEDEVRAAIDCAMLMVSGRNQQLDGYHAAFDKLGRLAGPEEMKLVVD